MQKNIKAIEEFLERVGDDIREKESELTEAKKHAQKAKKYEALYERDRKLQEFVDKYPETRKQETLAKQRLQDNIVALMKHISKGVETQTNLPSAERFADMKAELTFKEAKMQNSKDTLIVLQKELERRKEELEKITNLDKKSPSN